ncbi:probable CCR4-associated factor 1 homolog 11 [Andrographis paniculata]|uniref:probable CCR4-associated factor 1 homolog 11 n=1 Tax=Andrographis paniculata TaxID=175694 RepID=UPI0021E80045|nr:probable CCR4-associated factor 1 homolog 11 [Andrographis paniculata]
MASSSLPIRVREVWQHNVPFEIRQIRESISQFPFASINSGAAIQLSGAPQSPEQFYAELKLKIDAANVVQIGLTLADASGNLPTLGTSFQYIWNFNFLSDRDLHSSESIDIYRQGIESSYFAFLFKISLLGFSRTLTWISFQGAFDFGLLVRILSQRPLPEDSIGFRELVRVYFGRAVFDLKKRFRLDWELDRAARSLGLNRAAQSLEMNPAVGQSRRTGSDSLLTMQVFLELKKRYGVEIQDDNYVGLSKL